MTASRRPRHHYKFDEYLALCEDSTVKLEFWDGQIYVRRPPLIEEAADPLRQARVLDRSAG